jgi:catechol 2,3-dioxygenase-like lactoylglutathione lyase family enzyme
MTLPLLGLSHVCLSVPDLDAAVHFWVDVLGFEPVDMQPTYRFVFDRGAGLAVILTDHDHTVTGAFDERHTGLDHLAYAVPDVESLLSWEQRLDGLGVPHAPVVETDAGHHLNLRAPDNMPIELYVMKPEFAAVLGLDEGADPVAATP